MKYKNKILLTTLSAILLVGCGEETTPFDFSKPYYKVECYFESTDGSYVLNSDKTVFEIVEAGTEITIVPEEIEGYTCVASEKELTKTIPEAGAVTFTLNYRSDYGVNVTNKIIEYYTPSGVFSFSGDTIKIARNNLSDVSLIIDESNTRITGATPDVTKSGKTQLTTTWSGKEFVYDYEYYTMNSDISDVLDMLKVDAYKAVPYNTYNFDIQKESEKADLASLYKEDIAEPISTLLSNLSKHAGDETAIAQDKVNFLNGCIPAYKKFVHSQLESILRTIYSRLSVGVLASTDPTWLEGGVKYGEPSDWATYIKKDPTEKGGDNRWWIPEAYKPYNVLEYASHMNDVSTFNGVKTKFEELLIDAAKCGFLAISEALTCFYTNRDKALVIEVVDPVTHQTTDQTISMWWFIWTYLSTTPPYLYDGHIQFDATTVTEWRINSVLFNKNDPVYSGGALQSTLNDLNYTILYQIHKEITHQHEK